MRRQEEKDFEESKRVLMESIQRHIRVHDGDGDDDGRKGVYDDDGCDDHNEDDGSLGIGDLFREDRGDEMSDVTVDRVEVGIFGVPVTVEGRGVTEVFDTREEITVNPKTYKEIPEKKHPKLRPATSNLELKGAGKRSCSGVAEFQSIIDKQEFEDGVHLECNEVNEITMEKIGEPEDIRIENNEQRREFRLRTKRLVIPRDQSKGDGGNEAEVSSIPEYQVDKYRRHCENTVSKEYRQKLARILRKFQNTSAKKRIKESEETG